MRKFTAVALATASLLPLATSAFAQDAAVDEGVSDGEEIIVQARRKDESIQDVPLSVQAVTGQDLQKLEIRNFTDITKLVPGLQLNSQGFTTSASLRGVNFNGTASGSATSVEFYRNDAVITSSVLFAAVYDIGQIEVLRGPQGTLRGRASPSGSITVTTRRPDLNEVGGYVSGSLASRSKWNFEGAVNIPIVADKLAIRIAGFAGKNQGNGIRGLNVPTGTIDSDIFSRTQALRASVRADPFDGVLVLDFNYETIRLSSRQYSQSQSLADYTGSTLAADQSPRTVTPADRLGIGSLPAINETRYKIYNWQAKFRQWGQALTYVGNRVTSDQQLTSVSDAGGIFAAQTPTFPFVNPPAGLPIGQNGQRTDNPVQQWVHEIRLQNEDRIAGLFDYVIGGFTSSGGPGTVITNGSVGSYRSQTPASATVPVIGGIATSPVTVGSAAFPNGIFPTYRLDYLGFSATGRLRTEKESSLFGNLTVHIGENTEISGGLRHIWYKTDSGTTSGISLLDPFNTGSFIQRACFGGKKLPDLNNPTLGANFVCGATKQATIYQASLKHKFTEDLMAYFSFGTSWRPGNSLVGWGLSQGIAPVYSPAVSSYVILPDETSKSFEIGLKASTFDRRLRFNISAYYQKFNNFPIYPNAAVSLSAPNGSLNPVPALINSFNFAAPAPVTVKGIEADLAFDVSENFNLSATFAFADSKANNVRVPCNDLNNDNIQDANAPTLAQLTAHLGAGEQVDTCLVNAAATSNPRFSGTVQAEYSHPLGDWASGYFRGLINWKGATANDVTNPRDDVDAYALVDLFAGLRGARGHWEAGVFVKNLFDKRVVLDRSAAPGLTSINTSTGAVGSTVASQVGYNYLGINTTPPREVGVSLRYAFGSR